MAKSTTESASLSSALSSPSEAGPSRSNAVTPAPTTNTTSTVSANICRNGAVQINGSTHDNRITNNEIADNRVTNNIFIGTYINNQYVSHRGVSQKDEIGLSVREVKTSDKSKHYKKIKAPVSTHGVPMLPVADVKIRTSIRSNLSEQDLCLQSTTSAAQRVAFTVFDTSTPDSFIARRIVKHMGIKRHTNPSVSKTCGRKYPELSPTCDYIYLETGSARSLHRLYVIKDSPTPPFDLLLGSNFNN